MILPILADRGQVRFWCAVVLTGIGTGLAAAALSGLLELTQQVVWGGARDILAAAPKVAPR